jgi:hypothetical protein
VIIWWPVAANPISGTAIAVHNHRAQNERDELPPNLLNENFIQTVSEVDK